MTMKIPAGLKAGVLPPATALKTGASTVPSSAGATSGGSKQIGPGAGATVGSALSDTDQAWTIVTTATAVEGGSLDGPTKARHQVMLAITSGTADGGHLDIVAAGKKVVVVGTSVRVDAFIRRQDAQAVASTASSTVTCFISRGEPDAEAYPSQWIEPAPAGSGEVSLGLAATGMIAGVPGILKSCVAWNFGTAEGTLVLLDAKDATEISIHNSPIVFVAIIPAGGFFAWDLPRGRRFFRGLGWMVSDTRNPLHADATQLFRVDAEIGLV